MATIVGPSVATMLGAQCAETAHLKDTLREVRALLVRVQQRPTIMGDADIDDLCEAHGIIDRALGDAGPKE